MENKIKPNGYWNYENYLNEAVYRGTKNKFRTEGSGAFTSATRNGWLEKIYSYMGWKIKHSK